MGEKHLELEKLTSKKVKFVELFRYILSRTLIVFFLKFVIGILRNNVTKVEFFFDGFDWAFWETLLGLCSILFSIILTLVFINFIFTLLRIKEKNKNVIGLLKQVGLLGCLKHFFKKFFLILHKNWKFEWNKDTKTILCSKKALKNTYLYEYTNSNKSSYNNEKETTEHWIETTRRCKLTSHFIIFATISLLFFKGNPALNNYYGVYNNVITGIGRDGQEIYGEDHYSMIEKENWNEEELRWNYFQDSEYGGLYDSNYGDLTGSEKNFFDDIDISKRGYIFAESGFIDGFTEKSMGFDIQDGFKSYYRCLFFYVFEKFIITILFFLIPFLIAILYLFLKTPIQKHIFTASLLTVFPIFLHFGYLGDLFQTGISITLCFISISFLSFLRLFLNDDKRDKNELWISGISIIIFMLVYVSFRVYYQNWRMLLLLLPLLLWWGFCNIFYSKEFFVDSKIRIKNLLFPQLIYGTIAIFLMVLSILLIE